MPYSTPYPGTTARFPSTEDESPLLFSTAAMSYSAEEDEEPQMVFKGGVFYAARRESTVRQAAALYTRSEAKRLHHQQRLDQVLRHTPVTLSETAKRTSQSLLDAILEFAPYQVGMSMAVDADEEASLVLTGYWPSGTLHVEHFFHFPVEEPDDTVVNFYAQEGEALMPVPAREWGWYCPVAEFRQRLREKLRDGRWPLQRGW